MPVDLTQLRRLRWRNCYAFFWIIAVFLLAFGIAYTSAPDLDAFYPRVTGMFIGAVCFCISYPLLAFLLLTRKHMLFMYAAAAMMFIFPPMLIYHMYAHVPHLDRNDLKGIMVAIMFFGLGFYMVYKIYKLKHLPLVSTLASITDVLTTPIGRMTTVFEYRFAYDDQHGNVRTGSFRNFFLWHNPRFSIGDAIEVMYDPTHPETHYLKDEIRK